MYLARVYVTLKPTVNDPQGLTVLGALRNLGLSKVNDVRVGKYLEVRVNETDRSRASGIDHLGVRRMHRHVGDDGIRRQPVG